MDKFSLYDLLGLILPGAFLVFVSKLIFKLFGIAPTFNLNNDWEMGLGITACLVIVFGALLYTLNFWLFDNVKFYDKILRMHTDVADIFIDMEDIHKLMISSFNKKAQEWYGHNIFFSKNKFKSLKSKEKELAKKYQDKFYIRMYYELDYNDKIDNSRAFQSFYYFFRQMTLASLLIICASLVVWLISLFPILKLTTPKAELVWLLIALSIILIICTRLAQWYRKKMVYKMYWTYFTHLNQKTK